MHDSKVAVGVDLGGTQIRAAVFDGSGARLGPMATRLTAAQSPRETTLGNFFDAIAEAEAKAEASLDGRLIEGVGIGSTGPHDPVCGVYHDPTNLPHLHGFNLIAAVEERCGRPARMTNDANAFALAETYYGSGRGASIVVGITLGTGCGCGIVIDGRILEGATANTGELYRAPLLGTNFDARLSGPGLEERWRDESPAEELPGAEIMRRATSGDLKALAAYDAFGRDVGDGLGIIASVLDPEIIVLGGSVTAGSAHFLETAITRLRERIAPNTAEALRVEPARLGGEAGALGAAALFFTDLPLGRRTH